MAKVTNSSFIPKRTTTQGTRQVRRKNFFVFSIFSYALFVAAPIASGVVFIYEKYTDKIFDQAVIDLDSAIQGFSEADLQRVTEFNSRLIHVEEILFKQLAYNKVLQILENNTTAGVQFTALDIKRTPENDLMVTGTVVSETFDAALFQKEIISKIPEAANMEVSLFSYSPAGKPEEETAPASKSSDSDEVVAASSKPISFQLRLSFTKDTVAVVSPGVVGEVVDVVPDTNPISTTTTLFDTGTTSTESIETVDTPVTDTGINTDTI